MRYAVALALLLFAVAGMQLAGCADDGAPPEPQCRQRAECGRDPSCAFYVCETGRCVLVPRQRESFGVELKCEYDGSTANPNSPGVCMDGVCVANPCNDDDPCTLDFYWTDGSCTYGDRSSPTCDLNGVPGVCIDGVCEEDPCRDVVCDDGDSCTRDWCFFRDGTCRFEGQHPAGTPCTSSSHASGVCINGVCQENLCRDVVCDDGDDLCTQDSCNFYSGMCRFTPTCPDRPCHVAICDPADGSCSYVEEPDGTVCNHCNWTCKRGACTCNEPGFCICF